MQYSNLIWRDGQPYSEMFDDIYYSSNQEEDISGENEFMHVFFKHNELLARWESSNQFIIAELGLGSGLNCLLTIREWLKHCDACGENKTLHYIAMEKYPLAPEAIVTLLSRYPSLDKLCGEFLECYPPAVSTTHTRRLFDGRVVIHFKFLDVIDALKNENLNVDAWYLDGFSPAKNTSMWTEELFEQLAINSCANASFSTYTSAGFVKRNLQAAGFQVNKVKGFGRKRDMLQGQLITVKERALKYRDKPWFVQRSNTAAIPTNIKNKHASIVGSGIAGLSMAYALIQRGWTVTIIDKHADIAQEASSNPAAIVYPRLSLNNDADMEFYTSSFCFSVYMLNQLQNEIPKKFWFDCGLVQKIENKRLSLIIDKYQLNEEYLSSVNADEINVEGFSFDEKNKYIFANFKSAGVVQAFVLCEVLRKICGDKLTLLHADVDCVLRENNKWQCLSNEKEVNECDVLILANGVGGNNCGIMPKLPIESVRGQVAVFNENANSKKLNTNINSDVYVTPSVVGQHYVGATYSRNNDSLKIDEMDNEGLLASVKNISPSLFNKNDYFTSWVGIRAMSKDRAPIVGAMPDETFFKEEYSDIRHGKNNKSYQCAKNQTGLYVSSAHGSRGFTTAFLSAEIIAAQINNEPMPVNKKILDYLSPARFVVNELKKS